MNGINICKVVLMKGLKPVPDDSDKVFNPIPG